MDTNKHLQNYIADDKRLFKVVQGMKNGFVCAEIDRAGNFKEPRNEIKVSQQLKVYGKNNWMRWILNVKEWWQEFDVRQQEKADAQAQNAIRAAAEAEAYKIRLQAVIAANQDLMNHFDQEWIMPDLYKFEFLNSKGQECVMLFSATPTTFYNWGDRAVEEIQGIRLHNIQVWAPDEYRDGTYHWSSPSDNAKNRTIQEAIYHFICDNFWK